MNRGKAFASCAIGVSVRLIGLCLLAILSASCKERSTEGPTQTSSKQESKQSDSRGGRSEPMDIIAKIPEPHQLTISPKALEGKTFQTAVAERRAFRNEIQATATIKPNEYRLIHVSPRIEGRVMDVMVELGDQVKSGQPLALIDSIELGQKKSAFLQALTARDVDYRNFIREKNLFEQRISSEKEYLDAKGTYEKSLASYRAAYEALRLIGLSEAQLKAINWSERQGSKQLSYFPLVAPQAGTVIERPITRGELVTSKDNAFTIADLSTVWILLDIYEQHMAAAKVGSYADIIVDAYKGETFRGKLVYVGYVLKPDTRTVDARVEIANPDRRLRPGMFARATLTLPSTDEGQMVIVVPREAIQQVDEKRVAFIEDRPGRYTVRQVITGRESGSDVEILSGVNEGEQIVTHGSFYLKSILLKEEIAGD